MPSADHGTDPVQAEFVIDLLEEEVAAIEAVLCVKRQIGAGTQLNVEFGRILFFGFIHKAHLFLGPCFGISNTISFTDIFFGTKASDDKGFVFSVHVYGFLYIVRNRIFCFRPT